MRILSKKYYHTILSFLAFFLWLAPIQAKEIIASFDFKNMNDDPAIPWMEKNNFEFKLGKTDIKTEFKDGRLYFNAQNSLFVAYWPLEPAAHVDELQITWGVEKYAEGADYSAGVLREGLGIVISFGTETIDSGSFWLVNVPYFLTFIMGQKEKPDVLYKGNFYKKGGRYICSPCNVPENQKTLTQVNLPDLFQKSFSIPPPPVTSVGFEVDLRDLSSESRIFIEEIKLIRH